MPVWLPFLRGIDADTRLSPQPLPFFGEGERWGQMMFLASSQRCLSEQWKSANRGYIAVLFRLDLDCQIFITAFTIKWKVTKTQLKWILDIRVFDITAYMSYLKHDYTRHILRSSDNLPWCRQQKPSALALCQSGWNSLSFQCRSAQLASLYRTVRRRIHWTLWL